MSQFVRLINHEIVDFFVQQAEDSRHCRNQILKHSPYLLYDRELYCLSGDIPEKASDSLVVAETFCNGKDIILHTTQCCGCYLGSEAGALAFAEPQMGLAVLEYNFDSPATGIYFPRLEEIQSCISCDQSIPFAVSCSSNKKDANRNTSERCVKPDVVAFEFTAILLCLEFLAKFHKCGSREVSMFGMVFCLAVLSDLYHAEPMAFDVAAMYEPHKFLIGKPAVCQYITKLYASADGTFYHLFCEFYLGYVIFPFPLAEYLTVMSGCMASFEFLVTHAVVALLTLFSNDGKIKKNLGDSIGGSHAETFESEHSLVGKVGMDPSDSLNSPAGLLMVGVIKNQADIIDFMVGTQMYAVPQLDGYMPERFSPVNVRIFHEPVKDIFPCFDQLPKGAVFLIAVGISYTEAGEKKKALEYGEQPIYTVVLACNSKCVAFRHLDLSENRTDVLHGGCHIRILKKVFDIREKRSNFVHRHGLEYVLVCHLKSTHFLAIRQEPMSFFMPLFFGNQYLRNLNKGYCMSLPS